MSQYDSKRFATEFSKRTQENLKYIEKVVHSDQIIKENTDGFLRELNETIDEIDNLRNQLCTEANDITNIRNKGKNELKSRLHKMVTKLDDSNKSLKERLSMLTIPNQMKGDNLYEVTQLLNSLMGIAVLPYEMFDEIFWNPKSEDRRKIVKSVEYKSLEGYIMDLYGCKKWNSTYSSDKYDNGEINKGQLVFSFLKHVRNAVCHSGEDGTLSILPLSEGTIIEEILFYDKNIKKSKEKFGMRLSVEEVRNMVERITDFYRMPLLGQIDKTETIRNAENRVKEILENA